MVHPIVEGAENFSYQIWPVDETCTWDAKFGMLAQRKQCWRVIKMIPEKVGIGEVIDSTLKRGVEEGAVPFKQERGFRENVATTRKKAKLTKDKKQSESNEALKTQKASSETREARRLKEEALKEKKALKEEALKEKNALKKKALKEKEALKEKNVLKKNNVLKKEKMLKAKRS